MKPGREAFTPIQIAPPLAHAIPCQILVATSSKHSGGVPSVRGRSDRSRNVPGTLGTLPSIDLASLPGGAM